MKGKTFKKCFFGLRRRSEHNLTEKERAICDMIIDRENMDVRVFQTTMKKNHIQVNERKMGRQDERSCETCEGAYDRSSQMA